MVSPSHKVGGPPRQRKQLLKSNTVCSLCVGSIAMNFGHNAKRCPGAVSQTVHLFDASPLSISFDLDSIPPKDRAGPELNADLDGLPMERTLGLLWRGESDTFSFTLNVEHEATSKRQIASAVASIFDPLGILACVTIVSKIILQDVW